MGIVQNYTWVEGGAETVKRGITAPVSGDPDEGAEYQIAVGEATPKDLEDIGLDEWRSKIDKTWHVFKHQ